MADTENVAIPITIPTINFEQAVTQAVVDSKLGELIAGAISSYLGNQYQLQELLRKEVQQVVSQEIRNALGGYGADPDVTPAPAAQRLRKMIVAEVQKVVEDPEQLQKIVDNTIRRY